MTTYLAIILLFCAPVAAIFFARTIYGESNAAQYIEDAGITSPFVAAFAVPLHVDTDGRLVNRTRGCRQLVAAGRLRRLHAAAEHHAAGNHDLAVPHAVAGRCVATLRPSRFGRWRMHSPVACRMTNPSCLVPDDCA